MRQPQRVFEFSDPLSTGDSSLLSCIKAIIAIQIGDMEKAIRYGMAALLMDLAADPRTSAGRSAGQQAVRIAVT
jgi:trehalose/maltose hydrolase-like predicted phosphorylase